MAPRFGRCLRVTIAACALASARSAAQGPPPDDATAIPPQHARRVVRAFDFEAEPTRGLNLPDHWIRAQHDLDPSVNRYRPGFPIWNEAELDGQIAHTGRRSVRVPVNGGSASLRLEPGVLPIFADADYIVAAFVRTEGLIHARARLTARLLDQTGAAIESSTVHSPAVQTAGRWQPIHVRLDSHADRQSAGPGKLQRTPAFLQIDLELLQPRELAAADDDALTIWPEDYNVAAWFDDVVVIHIPHVELRTPSVTNVISRPDRPMLRLVVDDLSNQPLRLRASVRDAAGTLVDRVELPVHDASFRFQWEPALDELGWYEATLELFDASHGDGDRDAAPPLETIRLALAWVDAPPTTWQPAPLGLVVEPLTAARAAAAAELVRLAGAGAVVVPAWHAGMHAADLPEQVNVLESFFRGLDSARVRPVLALDRVPDALARRLRWNPADPLGLLASVPRADWHDFVDPLLDQFSLSVRAWMIGHSALADPTASWPSPELVARAATELAGGKVHPSLFIPWRADRVLPPQDQRPAASLASWSVLVPRQVGHDAIPFLCQDLNDLFQSSDVHGPPPLIVLESPAEAAIGRPQELIRRVIELRAGLDRFDQDPAGSATARPLIAIDQPWRWNDLDQPQPQPELAVWRQLAHRLHGRRVAGSFPVAPGVRSFILAPRNEERTDRDGALVAWYERGATAPAAIHTPLGIGPVRVIDPFGNAQVIMPDATGRHHILLPPDPVFIEDVDATLARFIAALALEPAFLSMTEQLHQVALRLHNPWPIQLQGSISIEAPGGIDASGTRDRAWQIQPRVMRFSLGPGQSTSLPLAMAFSSMEEAGPKSLELQLDLEAEPRYTGLRVSVPFELGLEGLTLQVWYRLVPTAAEPDVEVHARVSNTGDQPAAVELRVFAPGLARAHSFISDLAPGARADRRFVFPQAAAQLRGQRVVVSVAPVGSGARLNRSVVID